MFKAIKHKYSVRWSCLAALLVLLLVSAAGLYIKWDITGDWEGLYLLDGPGWRLTVTDDLFPEDANALKGGVSLSWLKKAVIVDNCDASSGSCLKVEWNEKQGRGYVKNLFQDGRMLLINLSRFKNEEDELSSGIFVGGGLPVDESESSIKNKDETGMAYFDGRRWNHIWCNVNEAIAPVSEPTKLIYPQKWEFLGSRILENHSNVITISSGHRLTLDGVPLKVEKFFFYEAGDSYFTLVTKVTNAGLRPVSFYYLYGDEPWVGHFGTSIGNVGWLKGKLVKTEEEVDSGANTFAGMLDYGNDLAGEDHNYTGMANFIEWDKPGRPDMVYYSNHTGSFTASTSGKVPLCSDTNRFLGLQWGPRLLASKQSFFFTLAVGMANRDSRTGLPVKPVTSLN